MIFLQFIVCFYGWSVSVDSSDTDLDSDIDIGYEKLLKVRDDDTPYIPKKEYSVGGFLTNVQIFFHAKCVNIYSTEEAEELLLADGKYGQGWWKPSSDFRAGTEKDIVMCSTHPNRKNPTSVTIDQHEFFQRRNIKIPIHPGKMDKRRLAFHYRGKQKPIPEKQRWRLIVDCECTVDVEHELCRKKKISLSRGVGGDTSFFVHKLNSDGEYNVVAHICFSNSFLHRAAINPTPRSAKMIAPSTSATSKEKDR